MDAEQKYIWGPITGQLCKSRILSAMSRAVVLLFFIYGCFL